MRQQRRGELLVRRARHEQHAVHVAHIRDGHGAQILAGDAQGHPGARLDLFALGAVVGQHLDVDPLVAAVGGVLDRRARERDALEGDVRDLAVVADAGDHRDSVRAVAPHHGQVGLARQRAHGHVADRYVVARAAQPRREAGVEVLDRERLGVGRGAGGTEAEREDRGLRVVRDEQDAVRTERDRPHRLDVGCSDRQPKVRVLYCRCTLAHRALQNRPLPVTPGRVAPSEGDYD